MFSRKKNKIAVSNLDSWPGGTLVKVRDGRYFYRTENGLWENSDGTRLTTEAVEEMAVEVEPPSHRPYMKCGMVVSVRC